jgi:PIN domain nuclease of toxin-antitoxin system
MRLLLDTHVAIWAVTDDRRLSARARSLILGEANQIFVSAATVWEIAIKHLLSRGRDSLMPLSGAEALEHFTAAGYAMLAISPAHAAAIEDIPRLHGDPFDRLLLAQARFEPLRLLTRDAKLLAYGDQAIEV